MIRSSSHLCIAIALGCAAGCASAHANRPAGQPLSGDAIAAWGGETSSPAEPEPADRAPGGIALAGGEHLRSVVALVVFEGGPHPVCALYGLRATDAGLEEGRLTIECPDDGIADVEAAPIRYQPVEAARLAQLEAALAGARPVPAAAPAEGETERIAVRVETDRATVEGAAAPASWPPVAGEEEPSYAHEPRNLSELYEAVMYPHRFAER